MLETLDYTIRIGSTPTFLYFDLYLYSAYAAHFVYILTQMCSQLYKLWIWIESIAIRIGRSHGKNYQDRDPDQLH